jgi:uncharacterized OB-fold protein
MVDTKSGAQTEIHPLKRPAPQTNPETKPFWDAAAEGRFLIGRCIVCGKAHYYPRSLCPFCFGGASMEEASGEGEIYTVSVTHRGAPEPYAIGYVALDEGPRILTNFIDCDLDSLAIGQRVKIRWVETEGAPLPMFTRA